MKKLFSYCVLIFLTLLFCPYNTQAQTDTEFWFAPPEFSQSSNNFDRPILLNIASTNYVTQVTIFQPANNQFVPINITLQPNSVQSIDITDRIELLETKPANTVLNSGLKILANHPVRVFYEIKSLDPMGNSEVFILKGSEAIGKLFFVPMQNILSNQIDTITIPKPYSSFDIVATENNTWVSIISSSTIVGHYAHLMFTILLNKGQTYSATAAGQSASQHLGGSIITSDKPIAVTVKDDLMDAFHLGGCRDIGGDQLLSSDHLGTQYVAMRGSYPANLDKVFIVATENSTSININGAFVANIDKYQTYTYQFGQNEVAFIESNFPVSVLQLIGKSCNFEYAILNPLDCIGTDTVVFKRVPNKQLQFFIVSEAGAINSFKVNGVSGVINSSLFQPITGTNNQWKYSIQSFNASQIPIGVPIKITNNSKKFQIGIMEYDDNETKYLNYSDVLFQKYMIKDPEEVYCAGDSIILSVSPIQNADYHWQGPNQFNYNGSSVIHLVAHDSINGMFTVHGNAGLCPVEADSTWINVVDPLQVNIQSSHSILCEFDTLILIGLGSVEYKWSTGEIEPIIYTTPHHSMTYSVTGTDINGCKSDTIFTVNVKPTPHLEVSPNPVTINQGDLLTLNVTSHLDGTNFLWENGSSLSTIAITPLYSSLVNVTGSFDGCTASIDAYVYVSQELDLEYSIYIPNTFSPNDDGLNDRFEPKITDATIVSISIFNRWNERIFYSTNPENGWDGTSNGTYCLPGTYLYMLIYKKNSSESLKRLMGAVSIIRD